VPRPLVRLSTLPNRKLVVVDRKNSSSLLPPPPMTTEMISSILLTLDLAKLVVVELKGTRKRKTRTQASRFKPEEAEPVPLQPSPAEEPKEEEVQRATSSRKRNRKPRELVLPLRYEIPTRTNLLSLSFQLSSILAKSSLVAKLANSPTHLRMPSRHLEDPKRRKIRTENRRGRRKLEVVARKVKTLHSTNSTGSKGR
jgi:hypothetical protein